MKVINEKITNMDVAKDATTVIDPVEKEAIEQDEKSMSEMEKITKDLDAEVDGAPKAEKPKEVEMPKVTLDESLFEDAITEDVASKAQELARALGFDYAEI